MRHTVLAAALCLAATQASAGVVGTITAYGPVNAGEMTGIDVLLYVDTPPEGWGGASFYFAGGTIYDGTGGAHEVDSGLVIAPSVAFSVTVLYPVAGTFFPHFEINIGLKVWRPATEDCYGCFGFSGELALGSTSITALEPQPQILATPGPVLGSLPNLIAVIYRSLSSRYRSTAP